MAKKSIRIAIADWLFILGAGAFIFSYVFTSGWSQWLLVGAVSVAVMVISQLVAPFQERSWFFRPNPTQLRDPSHERHISEPKDSKSSGVANNGT